MDRRVHATNILGILDLSNKKQLWIKKDISRRCSENNTYNLDILGSILVNESNDADLKT